MTENAKRLDGRYTHIAGDNRWVFENRLMMHAVHVKLRDVRETIKRMGFRHTSSHVHYSNNYSSESAGGGVTDLKRCKKTDS